MTYLHYCGSYTTRRKAMQTPAHTISKQGLGREARRGSLASQRHPGKLPKVPAEGEGDWGQEEKGTTEDEMAGWHH